MARFDGKLTAAGEAPIDPAELLAAFGRQLPVSLQERQDAIACYLSASDGWREARQLLGGAFAGLDPSPAGQETSIPKLKPGKDR